MTILVRILTGVVAAGAIATVAHSARALSTSGALAATVTGTAAVAAGWDWAALLVAYFVGSALLSRLGSERKTERLVGIVTKTGPRDGRQVLANGSVFLVSALVVAVTGSPEMIWMAFAAGSLAASAADTWATEIGTFVGQPPRSIIDGRPLLVGESGGITVAGTAAALAGAIFIAGVAAACGWPRTLILPIIAGGIGGTLADSAVGAVLQRRSWCDACHQATEMRVHICGAQTRMTGGIAWLENDGVNLIATVVGALIAANLVPRAAPPL